MALSDIIPLSIDFAFIGLDDADQLVHPEGTPSRTAMTGLVGIHVSILGPIFVEFFEDYKDWLFQKLGTPDKWPEVWRFGRIVRNAISHGGTVDIHRKEPPTEWRGLSYSAAENGRIMLGPEGDLSTGDVFTLMIEMSEELGTQGCPN